MFRYPRWEKPSISILRKAVLNPGQIATCNACSGSLEVCYPSWITAMLAGSILMLAVIFVDSNSAEWLLNGIGLILMIVIPLMFTPLRLED